MAAMHATPAASVNAVHDTFLDHAGLTAVYHFVSSDQEPLHTDLAGHELLLSFRNNADISCNLPWESSRK